MMDSRSANNLQCDILSCSCHLSSINHNIKAKHNHRKKSSSIDVLKPKHQKKLWKSPRRLVKTNKHLNLYNINDDQQLHPVKLGRYKIHADGREKFMRMRRDGGTSLAIATHRSDKCVQTLGQLIGKKPVKTGPIQIITERMFKHLESMRDSNSDLAIDDPSNNVTSSMTCAHFANCSDSFSSNQRDKALINNILEGGIDFNQLRSLQDFGIDVGFIDYFERDFLLESAGKLILDLTEEQYKRLSVLKKIQSSREKSLAATVTSLLIFLCKSFKPGDLAPIQTIHNILGINI